VSDLFPATLLDLPAQEREVRREIAMREANYPRWVRQGTLKQATADRQLGAMRAVLDTLVRLQLPAAPDA